MGKNEEMRSKYEPSSDLGLDSFKLRNPKGELLVSNARASKIVASERIAKSQTNRIPQRNKQMAQRTQNQRAHQKYTSKETVKGRKKTEYKKGKDGISKKKKIIIGVLVIGGAIALGAGIKGCIDENNKPKATLKYALEHGETVERLNIKEDIPAKLTQLEDMASLGNLTKEQQEKLLYGTETTAKSIAKSKLSGAINEYKKEKEPVTTSDVTLKAYHDVDGGVSVRIKDVGEFYEKGFIDIGGNRISGEIKDYIITIADIQGLQDQFEDGVVSGEKVCEDCIIYLEDMSKFAAGDLTFDGQQFSFNYRGIDLDDNTKESEDEAHSADKTDKYKVDKDSEDWER